MSYLYNPPPSGIYGDPAMRELALAGASSEQPGSLFDVFGIPGMTTPADNDAPARQQLAEVLYNGYILSNPNVPDNLDLINALLVSRGYPDRSFQLGVTGGDRYLDAAGNVRSSTNHAIVPGADRTSPHLDVNGARAVDLQVTGIPNDVFDQVLRQTNFAPGMTLRYPDGHTHISLPPQFGLPRR